MLPSLPKELHVASLVHRCVDHVVDRSVFNRYLTHHPQDGLRTLIRWNPHVSIKSTTTRRAVNALLGQPLTLCPGTARRLCSTFSSSRA